MGIVRGGFMAPFLQRERGVGDHDVEVLELALRVQQLGVAQGVAPFNAVVVFRMQEHVHLSQRPGTADGFLPIQRILAAARARPNQVAALHQQRARAAGGITDLVAFPRVHQARHQLRDFGWRVVLARLLAAG
ncbi:hypothetical protein D3C72_2009350 [compost metagenome]